LTLALTLAASGTRFVASAHDQKAEAQNSPQQERSEPVSISSPPKVIHRVVPSYPEEAKKNRVSSRVTVAIIVNEKGEVVDAKVESGHPLFNEAALQAVKQWRFEPYMVNGKAISVKVLIPVVFKLSEKDSQSLPEKEKPVRVANKDVPKLIRRVEPEYPQAAVNAKLEGQVVLEAATDINGRVTEVKHIVTPETENSAPEYSLLVDAATAALKQWLYEPYIVDGKPKPVNSFTVTFTFRHGKSKKAEEKAIRKEKRTSRKAEMNRENHPGQALPRKPKTKKSSLFPKRRYPD
jgi:TonB family C-terminal domain